MKAFADEKGGANGRFVLVTVGSISGKGENVGYQHFLVFFSPQCFFVFRGLYYSLRGLKYT